MDNLKFHSDIPKDCPPSSAEETQGVDIYRLAKGDDPKTEDYRSHYEKNPGKHRGQCIAFGLSVLKTIDDVRKLHSLFPALGPYVHQCKSEPGHGRIGHTPNDRQPGHYTFWLYESVDRSTIFELMGHVDEV